MGINETMMLRDVDGENESKSSEKGEPKEGGKTFLERAKKYIPAWERPTLKATIEAGAKVATGLLAAQVAFSGISRVDGVSEASDTALALRDSKDLTDQTSQVAPDPRAELIGKKQTASYVAKQERVTAVSQSLAPSKQRKLRKTTQGTDLSGVRYNGPSTKEIWPHAYDENVVGKWAQGVHLRNRKLKILGLSSDVRSRSAMETSSRQREQSEGKRAEDLELSKEEFDTLKSFAAFLEGHPKARECLRNVQNDKDVMEGMNGLMQDEVVRRCVISELKNKENVEQALLLWENPKALQVLKKVLNSKEYMETFRNLIQDKELRGHDLYSLENTQKSSLARRIVQEIYQPAETPSTDDTPSTDGTPNNTSAWIVGSLALTGLAAFYAVGLCFCRRDSRGNQGEQRNQNDQGNQGELGRERNRLITEFANQHDKLTFGSDSEQSSVHSDREQLVSQSGSCNKRLEGPKNQNEKFMVWLALAQMRGETIKAHEKLAIDNPERFKELKKWASEEFEKWKKQKLEVEQGISRPLTLGGPSSSLGPEGSSSEPVPHIGIEMSPLPSERADSYTNMRAMERAAVRSMLANNESRMGRCNGEEATTSATVPSLESSNEGKQPVSVYDDPGPLSRTNSSSSLEGLSLENS